MISNFVSKTFVVRIIIYLVGLVRPDLIGADYMEEFIVQLVSSIFVLIESYKYYKREESPIGDKKE